MVLRVLTWNVFHGRAVPGAGRDLFDEFADALAGWEWDVSLLQEVPPWWPGMLAARLDADVRSVLTSRNALLPLRRAVALRWPDVIKSNGGGANAILARGDVITEHRWRRLCVWPERRWVHAVRLRSAGVWVANTHGGGPTRDANRAAATALRWAGSSPAVLGGDFNVHDLQLEGFAHAGGHEADHVFVRGLEPASDGAEPSPGRTEPAPGRTEPAPDRTEPAPDRTEPSPGRAAVLDRGRLSDHAPVAVTIARAPAR